MTCPLFIIHKLIGCHRESSTDSGGIKHHKRTIYSAYFPHVYRPFDLPEQFSRVAVPIRESNPYRPYAFSFPLPTSLLLRRFPGNFSIHFGKGGYLTPNPFLATPAPLLPKIPCPLTIPLPPLTILPPEPILLIPVLILLSPSALRPVFRVGPSLSPSSSPLPREIFRGPIQALGARQEETARVRRSRETSSRSSRRQALQAGDVVRVMGLFVQ